MRGKRRAFGILVAVLCVVALVATTLSALRYENFLENFLSNLLSDFFVGSLLGSLIAIWFMNWRLESEMESEEKEKHRRSSLRAITHLEILRDDVEGLLPIVSSWKENIAHSARGFEAITDNQLVIFEHRLWGVIQNDPELTSLLDPDLIRRLTYFYGALTDARDALDWTIQGWKVTGGGRTTAARMSRFAMRIDQSIKSADRWGEHLVLLINAEIDLHQALVNSLGE